MCGRFIPLSLRQILAVLQDLGSDWSSLPDDFWGQSERDAYPGSEVQLIIPFEEDDQKLLRPELKTWGYEASFKKGLIFNTRIETADKPGGMWRDSIENRRCVIPAIGFYEPHETERIQDPVTGRSRVAQYEFRQKDAPVILLAGIWKEDRFSIVTTAPNEQVSPVHKRMPVVVDREMLGVWLGPDYKALANQCATELQVIGPKRSSGPVQESLF